MLRRGIPVDVLAAVLVALAEAATVAPWLHIVAALAGAPDARVPSPVTLALVGLLAFGSARSFLGAGWDLGAARALSVAAWLVVMVVWFGVRSGTWVRAPLELIDRLLLFDGATVVLLALGVLVWWRGLVLGADPHPFTPDFLRSSVVRDLALLGSAGIVVWISEEMASAAGETLAWVVPFALVARLLSAAAVLAGEVQAAAEPGRRRLGSAWFGAALALSLAILVLSAVLSALAGPHVWRWVSAPVRLLLDGLGTLLFWILAAVAYLVFLALTPVFWLVHAANGGERPTSLSPPGLAELPETADRTRLVVPYPVVLVLEVALGLAVAVAVWWLVLRALRRYRTPDLQRAADEVHESTWSGQLALQQLRDAVRRWRPRRDHERRPGAIDLGYLPRSVREAYQLVLALLAMRGSPRRPQETPLLFADRMRSVRPDLADALDDLTLRYIAARYGELTSSGDLEAAQDDWAAIRDALVTPPSSD